MQLLQLLRGSLVEACNEAWVEGGQLLCSFEDVGWRMLAQPHFHQSHEDAIVGQKRVVEVVRFSLPFFAELRGHPLDEGGKLIKLLLDVGAVKEIKIRVVVDLSLFRP
jgi:hypothetical protein